MRFIPTELSESELDLQAAVRGFLDRELPPGSYEPGLGMDGAKDIQFSKKLAARGWVGMAVPRRYGGGGRSVVERFVVAEELLRRGAPVAHHWFADRQVAPLIARFGTEEQKARLLPAICRAEISFCIGMSEPDAGSDLASVRTLARKVNDGWLVTGTKIWTSHAHHHDWMLTLVRTEPLDTQNRHAGLSQVLIPLNRDTVTVNPIACLDNRTEFNEVVLDDVYVPDRDLLGSAGRGWSQVTSELVFERSGPDRWLSSYLLVEEFLRQRSNLGLDDRAVEFLGFGIARWWGLRNLSLALARSLDHGETTGAIEASLVKAMGTRFEQEVVEAAQQLVDFEPSQASAVLFERLLANAILSGPIFTIRGGTIEVLRSLIAKGL